MGLVLSSSIHSFFVSIVYSLFDNCVVFIFYYLFSCNWSCYFILKLSPKYTRRHSFLSKKISSDSSTANMHSTTLISALALAGTALSGTIRPDPPSNPTTPTQISKTPVLTNLPVPLFVPRQASACFIVGDTTLPAEVEDVVTSLQNTITCDASTTTLSGVPDVTSGSTTFSSIDFSASSSSPLTFALSESATETPLASTDLALFQDQLNVYLATEAGIRSVGGGLGIKAPKFFLAMQVARIKTAQGIEITDPGQTVEHLLGKVTKNAVKESQATLDQITALASELA